MKTEILKTEFASILNYTVNLSAWNTWNYLPYKFRFNSAVNEAISSTILMALKNGGLDHLPQGFKSKC